jgi:hypothetical protein
MWQAARFQTAHEEKCQAAQPRLPGSYGTGRRNALRRLCVRAEIRKAGRRRPLSRKIRALYRFLLKLLA